MSFWASKIVREVDADGGGQPETVHRQLASAAYPALSLEDRMPMLRTTSLHNRRFLAVGLLALALTGLMTVGAPGGLLGVQEAEAAGRDQRSCSYTVGYNTGPIPTCATYTFQAAGCTGEVPWSPGSPIPCPTIFPGNDHRVIGYTDLVNRGGVAGWAWDRDFAGTINVDIWVNGQYRTTVAANQHRPDLIAAGIGARAFHVPMALNPGDQVTVYGLGVNSGGSELGTDPYLPHGSGYTTITVP
jgi:hypothetical protein